MTIQFNGTERSKRDLLFYDIEIFKEDAMIVFKDYEKNVVAKYHNNFKGIHSTIENKILVGFNNYYYDDYVLTKMLNYYTPKQLKEVNDLIIYGKDRRPNFYINNKIESLDCFQQLSVSFSGLKKVEANMGKSIIESSVDFNIDRKLTEEEVEDTFKYCEYDVDMTIEIFKLREKSYFNTKSYLAGMLNKWNSYRWNTTTISANLVMQKVLPKWATIRVPEEVFEIAPEEAQELWAEYNRDITGKNSKKSIKVQAFDNEVIFGFGGLHSTHNRIKDIRKVKLLDVASLYPSIIIQLEALGIGTGIYSKMKAERIVAKHSGEMVKSDALKLVLNSIYGQLNNQYSVLFNPKASVTVCIYGQIILFELASRLSTIADIIQTNTDGVMFVTDDERYKQIWKDWEKEFDLTLELEEFERVIQKDVNNYIALSEDGYVLTKGGEVGRYNNERLFDNNSTRIVDIAITEHLLYDKDIIEILMENIDKPELFQFVLQGGPTFENGAYEEDGTEHQKVNRVFASRLEDSIQLKKKRKKDGGLVLYPNAPEKMFEWNGELKDLEGFEDMIDLDFYYQLILGKLEGWK